MSAPREFWLAPRRCDGDSLDTLHDSRPPTGEVITYVRKDIPVARIAELEARIARLREALTPSGGTKADYIGEIIDPDTRKAVSWSAIKMVMAMISARAALDKGEG